MIHYINSFGHNGAFCVDHNFSVSAQVTGKLTNISDYDNTFVR